MENTEVHVDIIISCKKDNTRIPSVVEETWRSEHSKECVGLKKCAIVDKKLSQASTLSLYEQVYRYRPEFLPLFDRNSPECKMSWNLENPLDAIRFSSHIHTRLLRFPEINRNSPCYCARRIIVCYARIKYLETFPPHIISNYSLTSHEAAQEVRLLRQFKQISSQPQLFSRLAKLLDIPSHGHRWNEITRFIASALPFAEQTEILLTCGSDDRSVRNPISKANKYHCSTTPYQSTRGDISRASCTSSNITLEAFTHCESIRQDLLLNSLSINPNSPRPEKFFEEKINAVRDRIALSLGLDILVAEDSIRMILTPSGTDAEMLVTSAALARLFSGLESDLTSYQNLKVTSIVCAQGEIGRGSANASSGKHFSSLTPSGQHVLPGECLHRYPANLVDVIQLSAREDNGDIHYIDDEVFKTVSNLLEDTKHANIVLLHVVMGSKTGFCCPSLPMVEMLTSKFPNRLLVVIDACQLRLEKYALHDFSTRGYITIVTGSKFFCGSPFCGAVIMPMRCVYELEASATQESIADICLPLGFVDYFSKYDFPSCLQNVRERMGKFMNVGLLLRWESALIHLEPYMKIPPMTVSTICRSYVSKCKALLHERWSHLIELLYDPHQCQSDLLNIIKPVDSIISLKIRNPLSQKYLTVPELKELHELLAMDLSTVLNEDPEISSVRFLLGQPVQLGKLDGGVIRIAMGADMVNTIFYQTKGLRQQGLDMFHIQDNMAIQKIALILDNWEILRNKYLEKTVVQVPDEVLSPLVDWNFSVKKCEISEVMEILKTDNNILGQNKLAMLYSLDAIDMAFQALLTSFPSHFEHRFAVKTCPLAFFIQRAIENNVGLECASIIEVQHAIRLGCPPSKIVYDSPCKTRADINYALSAGVEINADNFDELEIIQELVEKLFQADFPECTPRFAGLAPRIGIRINPLLHAIQATDETNANGNNYLNVSTQFSKFGIPLTSVNRKKIIALFVNNPWLSGLHCHVGSQGASLELQAQGSAIISELANEIDEAAGSCRIKALNIGGGLPANYLDEDVSPTFAEYVSVLQRCAPQLFERTGRVVLTEFGRAVSAKTGWTVSEVEYVKQHSVLSENVMDSSDQQLAPLEHISTFSTSGSDNSNTQLMPIQTAITHAGSDLFVRACYQPKLFGHRMSMYTSKGLPSTAPLAIQNVAGPLCFMDIIGRNVVLPKIAKGDYIVIHDTGANTMAIFSRHCSRPAPAVYGYSRTCDGELNITLLMKEETPEQVMSMWG